MAGTDAKQESYLFFESAYLDGIFLSTKYGKCRDVDRVKHGCVIDSVAEFIG
ncbi:uncharacterized protein METZ01_LOCUS280416 [marine metagenome]|uniref:Uncharacterized protein n=1 Tax=marine metagenome TaxID=408172 RepID=A0A382KWR7_9ZZZZ